MIAIRTALGRGSYKKITEFLEEIAPGEGVPESSPEALQSFQAVWTAAYRLGLSHRINETKLWQDRANEVALSLDRVEEEKEQIQLSVEKLRGELSAAHTATTQLLETSAAAEQRSVRLSEACYAKEKQQLELREQLDRAVEAFHQVQLEKARLEGQLEALKSAPAPSPALPPLPAPPHEETVMTA